jgi:hypothetical protein
MTELDNKLAQLFAQDEPTPDREAFVAAVHKRVVWRRWGAKAAGVGLVAGVAVGAGAIALLTPELVLYPVRLAQSVLTSPLGASACALAAIGLSWWSRFGDA